MEKFIIEVLIPEEKASQILLLGRYIRKKLSGEYIIKHLKANKVVKTIMTKNYPLTMD